MMLVSMPLKEWLSMKSGNHEYSEDLLFLRCLS